MLKELSFLKRAPAVASSEELAELALKLGIVFPAALVEFCSRWNGGLPSVENKFYPVPGSFIEFFQEYGPNARGVGVDRLLGATVHFPACSLLDAYELLNYDLDVALIPIAEDLFGNQVVLRSMDPGGLVYWRDEDLWERDEDAPPGPQFAHTPHLIPIAPDLEFFYNSLTSGPDEV